VALPWFFHWIPGAGPVFLPMHLPVVIAGLLVSPVVSGAVGLVVPLVSSLLTHMPPTPTAILMAPQLALLGMTAGLLWRHVGLNVYLSVVGAVIVAQLIYAAELALFGRILGLPFGGKAYLTVGALRGLPGMAIQLVVAPAVLAIVGRRQRGGYRALRGQTWLDRRRDRSLVMMFHGHLGPWVALGLKMGREILATLGHKGHFGLNVEVEITPKPPRSCMVDGLQLGTGCSYGKRNIHIVPSEEVKVRVVEEGKAEALVVTLSDKAVALTSDITPENLEQRFAAVLDAETADLFVFQREAVAPTAQVSEA